jgi:hypothetical protein
MRAPNFLIFLLALILAFVGVWEHLGAPVKIPDFNVPLLGSSKDIMPYLASHSFWLVFSAWVLLTVGVLMPKSARQRAAALARA